MSRPSEYFDFWEYTTTDKEGTINGIREDAPQKAKDKYQEWVKEREEMKKMAGNNSQALRVQHRTKI